MKKTMILMAALFLVGCRYTPEEVPPAEEKPVAQEEVAKEEVKEEKEEKEPEEKASPTRELPVRQESESAGDKFNALPVDTQIALLTPYFDERGEPESIMGGVMHINYGIGADYALIQVHSGVGSGHPVYKIQRQGDTFQAVDGVVYVGQGDQYEAPVIPSVQVTAEQLMADYKNTPHLYDPAAENTDLDAEYLNLDSFENMKNLIGQSQAGQNTAGSQEDLGYDGDLGDFIIHPNQPMFIDGELYSGDSGVSADMDMVVTVDELRASGYTIYVLSEEDYNQLIQDINNGVIPYEEALSHYLSNY